MNRRIGALAAALVLALIGAGLVISYVRGADARAVAAQHPVTVYVANKLIPAGTSLATAQSDGMISSTKVANSGRPAGALASITESNQALVATSDVQPGEFIMAARFGSSVTSQGAVAVPSGMVAVSVQLSTPARVANFITPGSHIVIYATHGLKSLATSAAAKNLNNLSLTGTNVLVSDTEVIAFGSTPLQAAAGGNTSTQNGSSSSSSSSSTTSGNDSTAYLVTVAVTPSESIRLVHAINGYTLYAGLLGPGTKVSPQGEADDGNAFGGNSVVSGGPVGAGSS